jgi:hypothetical protein
MAGETRCLAKRASSLSYGVTVTSKPDDTWSYPQVTIVKLGELSDPFEHADRNIMRRVAATRPTGQR